MFANRTSIKHRRWLYQTYEQILGKYSTSFCLQVLYTFRLYIYPALWLTCVNIHHDKKGRQTKVCHPSHLLQSHTHHLLNVTIAGLHHRTYLKIDCLHRGPITHHDAMIGCGGERCCIVNPGLMKWECWDLWDFQKKDVVGQWFATQIANLSDYVSKKDMSITYHRYSKILDMTYVGRQKNQKNKHMARNKFLLFTWL